jgi:integral membrane sensor domain MASE1
MKPAVPRRTLHLAVLSGLAGAYFVTAQIGFQMTFVAEQVTVIWAPSGIALAAILLLGRRVWPAIWIGAFAANATTQEPVLVAAAIATGNTLEALLGRWLLRRAAGFDLRLARLRDVGALIGLGAGASPLVAATIGAASLCIGGVQPWSAFAALWNTWWTGDAIGILIIAPFVLALVASARAGERWPARRVVEGAAGLVAVVIVCALVFRMIPAPGSLRASFLYSVFPLLIWSAVRFQQLGATLATLVTATFATWLGAPSKAASPTPSPRRIRSSLRHRSC